MFDLLDFFSRHDWIYFSDNTNIFIKSIFRGPAGGEGWASSGWKIFALFLFLKNTTRIWTLSCVYHVWFERRRYSTSATFIWINVFTIANVEWLAVLTNLVWTKVEKQTEVQYITWWGLAQKESRLLFIYFISRFLISCNVLMF